DARGAPESSDVPAPGLPRSPGAMVVVMRSSCQGGDSNVRTGCFNLMWAKGRPCELGCTRSALRPEVAHTGRTPMRDRCPYSGFVSPYTLRRKAARVVLLNEDAHVLLLSARDPADHTKPRWWEIPGGGIDVN